MTQTETPRKVTTAEEAVEVLNEKQHRDFTTWRHRLSIGVVPDGERFDWLSQDEAILIANDHNGYTDALEAELESLRQERDRLFKCLDTVASDIERALPSVTDDESQIILRLDMGTMRGWVADDAALAPHQMEVKE